MFFCNFHKFRNFHIFYIIGKKSIFINFVNWKHFFVIFILVGRIEVALIFVIFRNLKILQRRHSQLTKFNNLSIFQKKIVFWIHLLWFFTFTILLFSKRERCRNEAFSFQQWYSVLDKSDQPARQTTWLDYIRKLQVRVSYFFDTW